MGVLMRAHKVKYAIFEEFKLDIVDIKRVFGIFSLI